MLFCLSNLTTANFRQKSISSKNSEAKDGLGEENGVKDSEVALAGGARDAGGAAAAALDAFHSLPCCLATAAADACGARYAAGATVACLCR